MNISNEQDGIMYFAFRLQEATFHYTIDIYKAPLFNANQLAREYVYVADIVESGELNKSYLESIKDEFLDSINHDIILKTYWGDTNIKLIKQQIGASNLTDTKKIMSYLAHIWDKKKYFDWCKEFIKSVVVQKNQKKKIEQAIRCFLPELYAYGYSNVYIYNTNKSIFMDSKRNDIDEFLNSFTCKKEEYDVYLAVSKEIIQFKEILKKNIANLEFDDDGYFDQFYRFNKNKFVVVKLKSIQAIDPNIAMTNAKGILNIFTLFYVAIDNKSKFQIFKTAMIKYNDLISYVTDTDNGFSKIEKYSDIEAGALAENALNKLMETFYYDSESMFTLMNILKKHNSAILDDNIENSFLNLWSILEIITKNIEAGSKIEKIRNVTLIVLTNNYFKRVISDLDKNIKSIIGIEKYNDIIKRADIKNSNNNDYALACIIFFEKHETLRNEIYSLLRNNSNIRSRISQLNDLGGNVKHIFTLIKRYKDRVGWHITRIYRYRNCIVHSGESASDVEYICEHLHSYIDILINEFIRCLTSDMNLKSIDDVIVYNKLYNQELERILNKDIKISEDTISFLLK